MDIIAHTLWTGAGMAAWSRRRPIASATVAATMTLAALPDILHLLPVVAWWVFADGTLATLWSYAIAAPGQEPALPRVVQLLSHHLHCVMHSLFVVGAVTLVTWAIRRSLWIPLIGWWMHIVIDVFTHSANYYAVPVLYPITERGFDGLAWNTPGFMALNYIALGATGLWLLWSRSGSHGRCRLPFSRPR